MELILIIILIIIWFIGFYFFKYKPLKTQIKELQKAFDELLYENVSLRKGISVANKTSKWLKMQLTKSNKISKDKK